MFVHLPKRPCEPRGQSDRATERPTEPQSDRPTEPQSDSPQGNQRAQFSKVPLNCPYLSIDCQAGKA